MFNIYHVLMGVCLGIPMLFSASIYADDTAPKPKPKNEKRKIVRRVVQSPASDLPKFEPKPLLELLTSDTFYVTPISSYEKQWMRHYLFKWNDAKMTSFQLVISRLRQPEKFLQVLDVPVIGATINVEKDKFQDGEFFLYTVGDCGAMPFDKFTGIVKKTTEELNRLTGAKPKIEKSSRSVGSETILWVTPNYYITLVHCAESQNPKYIKIMATPKTAKERVNLKSRDEFKAVASLKVNVVKDTDGTVWIDNIPMVDQGSKGYCAPAAMARLLQYYGRNIDQHTIAQVAGTRSSGGTSVSDIEESFFNLAPIYDLFVDRNRPIVSLADSKERKRLVDEYNKLADKEGKRLIEMRAAGLLSLYDKDLLRKARMKACRSGFSKFKKSLKKNVDAGLPISWCLVVGMYPEERGIPQAGGGHMRLIIGYKFDKKNSENDEIIFTDTWGRGHEKKRMKLDDAFCATISMYSVEPRKVSK